MREQRVNLAGGSIQDPGWIHRGEVTGVDLLEVWRAVSEMRRRPALWVGRPEVRNVLNRVQGLYDGAKLPLDRLELDSLDHLFDSHERIVAGALGRQLRRVWPPEEYPPAGLLAARHVYLDDNLSSVWGRSYDRPLDPANPLHAAILNRNQEIRERWKDIRPPSPSSRAPERSAVLLDELPPTLSREEVAVLAQSVTPRVLAAAALAMEISGEQSEWLVEAAKRAPCDPLVLGVLAGFLVLTETGWVPPGWGWGEDSDKARVRVELVDRLRRCDRGNGYADLLRAYQYAAAGFVGQARKCLTRATTAPRLDFPERLLYSSITEAATRVGWPPGRARQLALGKGSSTSLLVRLKQNVPLDLQPLGRRLARFPLIMLGRSFTQSRRDRKTGALVEWVRSLDPRAVPDERWALYYDQVFSESEQAAIRSLQAELSPGRTSSRTIP